LRKDPATLRIPFQNKPKGENGGRERKAGLQGSFTKKGMGASPKGPGGWKEAWKALAAPYRKEMLIGMLSKHKSFF
jgi:hypothetical protein